MNRGRWLGCAALLALAISPRVAWAGDAALAEQLFRDGKALMESHDYAAACPKFEESYRQDPGTGTLLALALCRDQAGQLASAWSAYGEAASRARQEGRADREQAARQRITVLTPRLSRLKVEIAPSLSKLPGLVVERDGQPLPPAAWNSPFPIDGGEHVISVRADARKPWSQVVKVAAESDLQTVSVPRLELAPASASSPGATPPGTSDARIATHPYRTWSLVSGGVALVSLGIGSGFGLAAKAKHGDAERTCAAGDCPQGNRLVDDAGRQADIATAGFVVGGAALAAAVVLWVLPSSKAREQASVPCGFAPRPAEGGWFVGCRGSL